MERDAKRKLTWSTSMKIIFLSETFLFFHLSSAWSKKNLEFSLNVYYRSYVKWTPKLELGVD